MNPDADSRRVVFRRLLGVAGLALLMLIWPVPANAATPAFDLELDSKGTSVEVTVRFQQTISSVDEFEASGVLDRLIGGLPADQVDEEGRPLPGSDPLLVALDPVESGVTRHSDHPEDNPGAPATGYVTVEGGSQLVWLAVGAVAAIAAAVAWWARSKPSKPHSPSRVAF